MNAESNRRTKQVGDLVRVTIGQYAGQVGVIMERGQGVWVVDLENGPRIQVAFRMVELAGGDAVSNVVASQTAAEPDASVQVMDAVEQDVTLPESVTDETKTAATGATPETAAPDSPTVAPTGTEDIDLTPEAHTPSTPRPRIRAALPDNIPESLSKLSVRELWDLAKQRGVSVARTKADFLRIIEANFPEVNLATLKGKTLFDTVSSLHISRLRSKCDLLIILAETEPTTEAA